MEVKHCCVIIISTLYIVLCSSKNFTYHLNHNITGNNASTTTTARAKTKVTRSPKSSRENISSDELYVDSSEPEVTSESSVELVYANETDLPANESYWLSLNDAFDILTELKYDTNSGVHVLINSYNFFSRKKRFKALPYGRQHPFITIESVNKELRTTLADHVSELLEGKLILNPTIDFEAIFKYLGNNTDLLRAYVTITTYVTATNARKAIESTAAVTPGYYLTEAAFVAAQIYYPHLPPKNSSFWKWPEDLFKPDMIFYIMTDMELNPNEEFDEEAITLKKTIMKIYSLWEDPPCVGIRNTQNFSLMLEEMVPHLNTVLS